MSTESKGTEFYVGIFLAVGLTIIAVMLVKFGGVSKGLTKYYRITVEFPNASGLVSDAAVLLSGARIGYVEGTPYLLVREGYGVGVKLRIREDVKLPRDSRIVVDQSGLLGDCFVDVLPPDKIDPANLIQPGETIVGSSKPGLDALQQKGAIVLTKLADELDEFKTLTANLRDLVGEQNRKNLSETFEHLKATSANLSQSSKKLDGVLDKGDSAVDSAKKTFESADKAASDLRAAMTDFKHLTESTHKTLDSAKTLVDTGNRVLKKAEQGEGALGLLLTDKETAANLKAFAANLKRSGPVFYKDRAPEPISAPKRR